LRVPLFLFFIFPKRTENHFLKKNLTGKKTDTKSKKKKKKKGGGEEKEGGAEAAARNLDGRTRKKSIRQTSTQS